MLDIYKKLFQELEKSSCGYCVYKGINRLDDDLSGKRGDLDILVRESDFSGFVAIAEKVGFHHRKPFSGFPQHYVARDARTGRLAMLDLDVCIRLGPTKPVKPYQIRPDWSKMQIGRRGIVRVLAERDYIPLMLLTQVTSLNPKETSFIEILDAVVVRGDVDNWRESYYGRIVAEIRYQNHDLFDAVQAHTSWSGVQKEFRQRVINRLGGGRWKAFVTALLPILKFRVFRCVYLARRLVGYPAYRIRKRGFIVAFVGVDGAGKSSATEEVINDAFYKKTGVKRIYFGTNEYWIPGALRLNRLLDGVPWVKYLPKLLLVMDRQLRLFRALYYRYVGNVVVCDRYYYDDIVCRRLVREEMNDEYDLAHFLDKVKAFVRPRMLIRPDLTIYLDVSPEAAYSRKQDYPFETMLKTNAMYKMVMSSFDEVVSINADGCQSDIRQAIYEQLEKLCLAPQKK